ncbi:hypothetical protein [Planktothrix sp. FACHB-1365]|nr:hypothetical protein [Planktothrix sp. FACHB-1365]MBD2485069.1 hypothetical protein [Planktothrix sp. FACHB-1365]
MSGCIPTLYYQASQGADTARPTNKRALASTFSSHGVTTEESFSPLVTP